MRYKHKELIKLCGRAIHAWGMIRPGERVAVAVSGGKDSLSLLWLLVERRRRVPIDYELVALHVQMGFEHVDSQAIGDWCSKLGVEFVTRSTDIGPRAHSPENRSSSPCFFCAMHRRRELFEMCAETGCSTLALGHHQDDVFETLLMNMFFSGYIGTMKPVQPLFRGRLRLIRPLILATASHTRSFAKAMNLPVQPPCCPSAGNTNRAFMGRVLREILSSNPKARANLWHAITHSGLWCAPGPIPGKARWRKGGRGT